MTRTTIGPSSDAAQSAAATSELLLAALDVLSEGVGVFDRDLQLVGCNARFSELRSYPAGLCRHGTPIAELFRFHAENGDYGSGDIAALVDTRMEQARRCDTQEFECVLADQRAIRVRYAPIPAGGLLVTYTEPALVAAPERMTRLLTSSPAVLYSFEATGNNSPTFISDNVTSLFGYEPREYLEGPNFWLERVHPDDISRVLADFHRLFEVGHHRQEYRFRRKDGSYCWVDDILHLIHDSDGGPVEVVGSWSDITARKKAEKARRRSEQLLADALETISEGFALYDSEDRLILCNSHYKDILYPIIDTETIVGSSFESIIRHAAGLGLIPEAGGRIDSWVAERLARHRDPGGPKLQHRSDDRWIQINERRMQDGGTVAVYSDVTELKRAEEALRTSLERYDLAMQGSNEALWDWDAASGMIRVPSRFRESAASV